MPETIRHDVELGGCTPEPLMSYLKALGVLRLVAEQADPEARGWWDNGVFVLRSFLGRKAIRNFLLKQYRPTPIVAPWGARSGFFPSPSERSARKALTAILSRSDRRFRGFRKVFPLVRSLLTEMGLGAKAKDDEKLKLLEACRSRFPDGLLDWLDACYVLTSEEGGEGRKFPPLLGTGGNEGSGSYVSGFAQQVVECLVQRKHDQALAASLFGDIACEVAPAKTQTPGHFSPSAAGGANAGQGFEGACSTKPWDYLLCLEGTCIWASAAVRRLGQMGRSMAAFPFTVTVSGAGDAGIAFTDRLKPKSAKRSIAEMWLPLWNRPAALAEVRALVSEGKASTARGNVQTGLDFARAAASLGVDRGIEAFQRTAFLMRNGQSFLNIPLGRFQVRERREVDLLREADPWLDRFRRAAGSDKAPPRFQAALRCIDQAVFDLCRYGGAKPFQTLLVALGRAERELALTEGKVGSSKDKPPPLGGLSAAWAAHADDGSAEFALALALASIHDPAGKIARFRANLEPVDDAKRRLAWAEKNRAVVWNAADLATNLAAVLQRRMMEAQREGCAHMPLAGKRNVPLGVVATFLEGEVDDRRVEDLLWGLMLLASGDLPAPLWSSPENSPPLARDYALLKLLFLPSSLAADRKESSTRWRYARSGEPGLAVRPEPRVPTLLRAGRVGEACRIAAQRLRVCGLAPLPGPLPTGRARDEAWAEAPGRPARGIRLAAALLAPLSSYSVNLLVRLVCRDDCAAVQSLVGFEKEI